MPEHGLECPCEDCEFERQSMVAWRAKQSERKRTGGPQHDASVGRVEYRRGKPVVSKGCKDCHNKR